MNAGSLGSAGSGTGGPEWVATAVSRRVRGVLQGAWSPRSRRAAAALESAVPAVTARASSAPAQASSQPGPPGDWWRLARLREAAKLPAASPVRPGSRTQVGYCRGTPTTDSPRWPSTRRARRWRPRTRPGGRVDAPPEALESRPGEWPRFPRRLSRCPRCPCDAVSVSGDVPWGPVCAGADERRMRRRTIRAARGSSPSCAGRPRLPKRTSSNPGGH